MEIIILDTNENKKNKKNPERSTIVCGIVGLQQQKLWNSFFFSWVFFSGVWRKL